MGEKMTLEQVRDYLRNEEESYRKRGYMPGHYDPFGAMADAIDFHLNQPAQAVDVGTVLEVAAEMRAAESPSPLRISEWADKLTAALPNANGKEG